MSIREPSSPNMLQSSVSRGLTVHQISPDSENQESEEIKRNIDQVSFDSENREQIQSNQALSLNSAI